MNLATGGRRISAGLFFLSAGVLCYELLLMRIFSVLMWYHFASLAIGLALLGLGAGGIAVGLLRPLRNPGAGWLGAAAFGVAVLLFLGFLAVAHADPALAQNFLAPFHQPFYKPFARSEVAAGAWLTLRLGALASLAGLPFLGAGITTAAALARSAPRIHRPYAATFLGSAAGCLVAPGALALLSAPAALGLAALLGILGGFAFAERVTSRFVSGALAVAAILGGGWAQATGGAEIPFARGRYESNLLAVRWNPMSRVAAYGLAPGETERSFGLSGSYRGRIPPQLGLVVDDSGYTNLYEGVSSKANSDYFRSNLVALSYHLRPNARALILGPGGGKDVWIALAFPETTVRAVEINPQVVEMVEDLFADFTGRPYSESRVELTVTDGRRFTATDSKAYDLIEASAVFGRMPPAAGAFTLSEDQLHTMEAFQAYWKRLTPRGILSLTRFAYDRRALRLAALARALLDRMGVPSPAEHVRVVSDRGLANVMVSRSPFSAEDDRILAQLVSEHGFNWLFPSPEGPTLLTRILTEPALEPVLAEIPFDVSPPTDDRPFFYYTVRPGDFFRGSVPGRPGFDNRGAEILRSAFGVLSVLTIVCLLAPVAVARGFPTLGRGALFPLVYAAALGFGYLALEIGTMKRFSLFLGHPIYSASATLFAFLLGGGLGSLWSNRFAPSRAPLAAALVAAAGFGLVHAFITPRLLGPALALPDPVRWTLAAALVLPLAFSLGICFPAGMARFGPAAGELLPWAWAVNGAAGVVGSLGSVLIAMNLGYTVTLTVGSCLYLVALAASMGFPRVVPP